MQTSQSGIRGPTSKKRARKSERGEREQELHTTTRDIEALIQTTKADQNPVRHNPVSHPCRDSKVVVDKFGKGGVTVCASINITFITKLII